ncbi:hypothetical protein K402DRAFT_397346 [Aulographum hederae CBS 113979]|uniref:Uncharacterized protein n=1 Tax=Aulographum hederae CBS 113979 TaxID=1176131 RepID=A0A6G1GP85_9PEZI|nr:hypothetical protein K402DRAFT_397346 [Aulographum hederae CBS 113979]
MLAQRGSPTARLLRNSRLFSIPQPLPDPALGNSLADGSTRFSDSATRPYPTRQAITTPPSSLGRGDWGLKRPLPLRTTARGTDPTLRIIEQDSWEQITDFEPANAHTKTLRKFQELGVAIQAETPGRIDQWTGAYETTVDNTALEPTVSENSFDLRNLKRSRWKFGGPAITTMAEGDFNKYMQSIEKKKGSFTDFLCERILGPARGSSRMEALAEAESMPGQKTKNYHWDALTKREQLIVSKEIAKLRKDTTLASTLADYIREFLDLPPLGADGATTSFQAEKVPSTHPAAGLSYLRSDAILDNHPIHGPQKERQPVDARALGPASGNTGGMIGVAGIAVNTAIKDVDFIDDMESQFVEEGGIRVKVVPLGARIDHQGRIGLRVGKPGNEPKGAGQLGNVGKLAPRGPRVEGSVPRSTMPQDMNQAINNLGMGSNSRSGGR